MGKTNGGQAAPGKVAKHKDKPIVMGGTIHVAGPDFRKMLAAGERIIITENALELVVQVDDSRTGKIIEAGPVVLLDESDIKISTDFEIGDIFYDHLTISIKDKNDRKVELCFNVSQVQALSNILSRYLTAYDAVAFLQQKLTCPP